MRTYGNALRKHGFNADEVNGAVSAVLVLLLSLKS